MSDDRTTADEAETGPDADPVTSTETEARDRSTDPEPDRATAGGLAIREPPVVLLPLAVLDGETVSESLVEFLAPTKEVLLAYHELPEQTPTEQASLQFEERAREAIEDLADAFRDAGSDPETRVVFTHGRQQTIDRVAGEVGATAVLLPNPTGDIDEVLVPIREPIDDDRLADLVTTLIEGENDRVTLWGLTAEGDDFDPARAVERAAEELRERGVDSATVTTETSVTATPVRDIVERSADADVIVMREGTGSVVSVLLGDDAERIATGAVAPVLVLRDRTPSEAEPDDPLADADASGAAHGSGE